MRVRLDSIGCRLNIAEMESLGRRFAGAGHRVVGPGDPTDLIVLNTCAVTQVASRKSRKLLRQLRRAHPDAWLVATGCHADLAPDEVAALGVDMVVANRDKDSLPAILQRSGRLHVGEPMGAGDQSPYGALPGSRTRAFVKVQDGCDNRCTFCIVTVARGDGRSVPATAVVDEVDALVAGGTREVVLTGVHLGSYGADLGEPDGLAALVGRLLDSTDVERLRLSSLEPWDLRPEFFDLWSDRRLQPHLHLPLQSGCDVTLTRMARRTSQREFGDLVAAARARIPDLAISTDIIVGFPGEDDAEFEDSFEFVRDMRFSKLHVFRYSPREGTAAAAMPGRVSGASLQERARRMHELGAEQEASFARSQLGSVRAVLWETSEPFGDGRRWSGLTDNYVRVVADTEASVDLNNRQEPTLLLELLPGAVFGQRPGSCDSLAGSCSTSESILH